MLTYIIVFVTVVAVLYGSFRALSGAQTVSADDYRTVMARLAEYTSARVTDVNRALTEAGADPPAPVEGRRAVDPLVETAAAARKALSGYQQKLATLDSDAARDERLVLDSARSLLNAAIEDYGWACRMIEAGTYRENPGVQRAVEALREHGDECMRAALPALRAAEVSAG